MTPGNWELAQGRAAERTAGSQQRMVRRRIWDVSGVLLNDEDIIVAAMEYGYGGESPRGAAAVLTHWGYEVSHYYTKPPNADFRRGEPDVNR